MPARRLLEEEDGDNALYTDFDVGKGRAGQGQSSSSVGSNTLKDAIAFVPPILMIAASQYADYAVDPYMRNEFDYKDGPSISFPMKDSIVDETRLVLLAWVIPAISIILITVCKTSRAQMYFALLALAEAASMSYTITVIGKKCAGSLRPCFKAECGWNEEMQACTGDSFSIRDARQSFPSGHSAAAGAGLGFLALFVNREVLLWCKKTGVPHTFLRPLPMVPAIVAFLIGICRTVTYHHRFEDIIMGLFIGAGCALTTFYSQPRAFTTLSHQLEHAPQNGLDTAAASLDSKRQRQELL